MIAADDRVICGVDPVVHGMLHGAADAPRNEARRPVGEDRRVERREAAVDVRHHRSQVPGYQFRVVLDGIREGWDRKRRSARSVCRSSRDAHSPTQGAVLCYGCSIWLGGSSPSAAMRILNRSTSPPSSTLPADLLHRARAEGEGWAGRVRAIVLADRRQIAGGWPGTLTEARQVVLEYVYPRIDMHRLALREADKEELVRSLYDSARSWWNKRQDRVVKENT